MTRRVTRALSGSRRVWEYAWNDQDQLREVVTPDGARWQYLYDGLGRRIAKQLMGDDGGSRSGSTSPGTAPTWRSRRRPLKTV